MLDDRKSNLNVKNGRNEHEQLNAQHQLILINNNNNNNNNNNDNNNNNEKTEQNQHKCIADII